MSYNDLSAFEKLMVLQWMYDGLNAAFASQVANKTYLVWSESVKDPKNKPFTIERIWNALRGPQQNHFEHVSDKLNYLQKEMNKIEKELSKSTKETKSKKG